MNPSTMNNLLGQLPFQGGAVTRMINAENPTGAKGGGSKGKPWEKLSPARVVAPGETLVLAETDGPGVIQSMWFGGDIGWNFILRVYWDGQKNPSIESPLGAFFGYGFTETVKDSAGHFPTLNNRGRTRRSPSL